MVKVKLISSPLLVSLSTILVCSCMVLFAPYLMPLPTETSSFFRETGDISQSERTTFNASGFDEALERPLFHANRRPPQGKIEEATPEVVERIEAPFELVGIMGGAEGVKSAYIQHKETQETLSVKEGEQAGDWVVDTIGQDFIALLYGAERRVIQLANGG